MLRELSNSIETDLATQLKSSPCMGVGIDESTAIRYVTPSSEVKTTFLKCVKVHDCKAIALQKATKDIMEEYDIADQKIVGFGSDGVSVIAGEMGGVSALLKKDNSFCIFVCCVCHRLDLAVSQACKSNQDMAMLQGILSGI